MKKNLLRFSTLCILLMMAIVSKAEGTFRDIKINLMEHSELLTEGNVYITVAENGAIGTTDNAENAAATIKGKVHGSYGSSNFTASVPVQGCVKITYATHDYGNDITVTNSEGTEVAKFNTKGAKWMSDPSNVVVAYYRTNKPTTLNFSKANYNPYFAVEAIDEADLPAETTKYNITFAVGEGATGTAPAALEIEAGSKFTAPKNYTLYKDGATLTGWNDGTKTYAIGEEITPAANMTLTAIYTTNDVNLAARTAAVTINYDLSGYNDNPQYKIEGATGIMVTQATVNSKTIDVKVDVDATNGKFSANGSGWHQVNAGTKVTVPSCKGATIAVSTYNDGDGASMTFAGNAGTADNKVVSYTATAEDATCEIAQVANNYWNKLTITLPAPENGSEPEQPSEPLKADRTATWDYSNATVMDETMALSQGAEGTVKAIEDNGVLMTVISNGVSFRKNGNNIQIRKGAEFRIPVQSTSDVVTIKGYPSYSYYSISGGEEIKNTNDNPVTTYKAKASDVEKGYVSVVSTNDNNYFYSLSVLQKSPYQEKAIYKTDFSEWKEAAETDPATEVKKQTKFTNEELTFSLFKTKVLSVTDTKFSAYTELPHMALRAEKNAGSYVTTSPLASISKIRYIHGATGGSRGWKLEAKGDGDADWVVISDAFANPNAWSEVTKEINKTNVQLRWTNLAAAQNAFMFELDIYAMVDMSKSPMLESLTANDTKYVADDIFEMDDDGNYQATIELSKTVKMVSAENPVTAAAANGEVGEITYMAVGTGCKVTIPVTANGKTANYYASFVQKPDFTLTYLNTDGTEMGTQIVEKDATISAFAYDFTTAKAGEGQKVRGWFEKEDGGRKFTTADVITADAKLYAVATDIEVANNTNRYFFALTDKNFYAEDHECFLPEGTGVWHDAQHGWVFAAGDKINVPVGGDANLVFGLCQYSGGSAITVTDASGAEVGTIANDKASSDGAAKMISYKGAETTLTITFGGTSYLHTLTIANIAGKPVQKDGDWIFVEANDAASLLNAIDAANAANSSTSAERINIFIPNGTYDFGKVVLSCISGHNVSLIGESQKGVIIKNAPAKETEGIGTTATLMNTGNNNYFQDLTIQNELDYYGAIAAGLGGGRAVCLWDKGTNTICKNVTMLSYQDTYYSNNNSMKAYWEDCDIHGTVDFICGGGDVRFQNSTMTLEKRNTDGKGGRTITAPTSTTQFGYVFDNCKVVDLSEEKGDWNFGRTWQESPICIYLNTTLDAVAEKTLVAKRWTEKGMNNKDPKIFGEFGTKNEAGTDITPASNKITSYGGEFETILTAEQAAAYSYDKMFAGDWKPATFTTQLEAPDATYANGSVTWTPANNGAIAYLIEKNGEFAGITSGSTFAITIDAEKDKLEIRAANARGGFGKAKHVSGTTGINKVNVEKNAADQVVYDLQGRRVENATRGIYIIGGKKVVIK